MTFYRLSNQNLQLQENGMRNKNYIIIKLKGAGTTIFFHTFSSISERKLNLLPVARFQF